MSVLAAITAVPLVGCGCEVLVRRQSAAPAQAGGENISLGHNFWLTFHQISGTIARVTHHEMPCDGGSLQQSTEDTSAQNSSQIAKYNCHFPLVFEFKFLLFKMILYSPNFFSPVLLMICFNFVLNLINWTGYKSVVLAVRPSS